jgi:3-oxoacyl-[acyl-carrier-protein] synthase-3
MDGLGIWNYIRTRIPIHIENLLQESKLEMNQLDQIVFHQASKLTLDSLVKVLKVNPEIVFSNIKDIGNTVSSSIPIAIADARKQNIIKPNSLVLISGFGVGLSYGSMIIRF